MNVFVVPSWYPATSNALSGTFVKEQVEALADLHPNHRFIVSCWGHDDAALQFRDWKRLVATLRWRALQPTDRLSQVGAHAEIFNGALEWSPRLPFGGAERLVGVNLRNFDVACRRWGRPDLIHAHVGYPGGYVASVIARERGVPYVLTEHMNPFPFPHLLQSRPAMSLLRQAFDEASVAIAVSPSLASRIQSFGLPPPVVIPNLVDERSFMPGPAPGGKFVFLSLGALSRSKGVDILLKAISTWNPPARQFEFRIAGDGPDRVAFARLAVELGVDDRVRWLGPVSRRQAPAVFRDSHAFVTASRQETFGVVCAEAIACGKPVVATRCGGPESIVRTSNGVLVANEDPVALAEGLQHVAESISNYAADVIRDDFLQRFSRPVVTASIVDQYEHAAAQRH